MIELIISLSFKSRTPSFDNNSEWNIFSFSLYFYINIEVYPI